MIQLIDVNNTLKNTSDYNTVQSTASPVKQQYICLQDGANIMIILKCLKHSFSARYSVNH